MECDPLPQGGEGEFAKFTEKCPATESNCMRQGGKVDNSLKERRDILELIERLKGEAMSLPEMEQIGARFRNCGNLALRPLLQELWRERSAEAIARYAYLLDFFDTDLWLNELIQMALRRSDLCESARSALLVSLDGYGVDIHSPPFSGRFTGMSNHLSHALQGSLQLEENQTVGFMDDFLGYPSDVQQIVIRELPKAGERQAAQMLEAMLWHEDAAIVTSSLCSLGAIRHPVAAGVLARYLEDGDPLLAPHAERSLRRLSFQGINPPERGERLPFHAAYASAPDGDGYRSLFISRWVEGGKLAALYMQTHERRGLLAAWGSGSLSEEGFRSELEAFGAQDDLHEVPADYLLDLVRDALYWSGDLSYLPADFYLRRGIFSGEEMTPAPYRPCFAEYAGNRGLKYLEGEEISREIFADPFFAGWFMGSDEVYGYAEEYRTAEIHDQEAVLERFCSELLAPELELIRDRLLASADLMRRCGRDSGFVARVVALAKSLVGNPLPHHLHPFLRGFALESMEIAREALALCGEEAPQAAEKL